MKFFKENYLFFSIYLVFLLLGLIFITLNTYGEMIIYFSEHRFTFLNEFFRYFTKVGDVYVYIFFLLLFLVKKRKDWWVPIAIGGMVMVISFGLKELFLVQRPYGFLVEMNGIKLNLIEGLNMHTGKNSFPSGHSTSAFSIFSFLAFSFQKQKWLQVLLIVTPILVAISRIYLAQHFLEDVLAGSFLGCLIGMSTYFFIKKIGADNPH